MTAADRLQSIREKGGLHLKNFKEKNITQEMCVAAVEMDANAFRYVPECCKTTEIYKIMCAADGSFLYKIPEDIITEEICLIALNNLLESDSNPAFDVGYGILKKIPITCRTKNVCLAAVKLDSNAFMYVPKDVLTYEICLAAVNKCASSVIGIPEDFYTDELCLAIAKERRLDLIPKSKWTKELCLAAAHSGPTDWVLDLDLIPDALITQELCDISVKRAIRTFGKVPERFVTEEMIMYVAENAPGLLYSNFPERYRNEKFINELIAKYPDADDYVIKYLRFPNYSQRIFIENDSDPLSTATIDIVAGVLTKCITKDFPSLVLPAGITAIARSAFYGSEIRELVVPEGVVEIREAAFYKCKGLRRLSLPSSLKVFVAGKELNLAEIEEIIFSRDNENYSVVDGALYNKDGTELIRCFAKYPGPCFVVPKTVNKIHEYAFADCNDIEEIILPDHRIEFGDYCFSCCKKLKRVNLPDDMEYLSYGMFANSGIEEFVFPSKLKCLGFKTFLGTNLKSFVLPLNLERIGMPYFPNEIDEFMIPTTVKCQVSKYDLAGCKVKHAVVFPENSYIDLDKDYGYLELFSAYYDDANTLLYSRQNKHDDEIFIKAVESKVLLKRHLVHIAATRLFVYNDNLSDTARAFYDEVLRKNRKAAILSFVNSGNFEYINLLIENNYVSTRDLKHIAEAAESTVSKSNT